MKNKAVKQKKQTDPIYVESDQESNTFTDKKYSQYLLNDEIPKIKDLVNRSFETIQPKYYNGQKYMYIYYDIDKFKKTQIYSNEIINQVALVKNMHKKENERKHLAITQCGCNVEWSGYQRNYKTAKFLVMRSLHRQREVWRKRQNNK